MNWRMILSVWTQLNGLVNWLMCRLYGNVSINNRHPDQCDHAYTHCCRCRSACVKRFVVVLLDRDRRQDINYAQFRRLLKTLLIFSLTGCLLAPWKYLGLIIYYYMFNIITKLWKKRILAWTWNLVMDCSKSLKMAPYSSICYRFQASGCWKHRYLEIYVRGHWRSFERAPFDRSHRSSYRGSIEIWPYHSLNGGSGSVNGDL